MQSLKKIHTWAQMKVPLFIHFSGLLFFWNKSAELKIRSLGFKHSRDVARVFIMLKTTKIKWRIRRYLTDKTTFQIANINDADQAAHTRRLVYAFVIRK